MKKFSIFFFIFIIATNSVFADVFDSPAKVKQLAAQIPVMDSISCKFKQEKYLKNIEKPLISYGNFEYKKNIGIVFDTTYPVQLKTSYTNENRKQINSVINAISSKKYSELEREFDFFFEERNNNWTLGLKPKQSQNSSKILKSITISGNAIIENIEILQNNGNKTVLWFTK
ncbi:MAG: outer membrane lipoprotein carrier protein LolA [Candidatus Gastranaerophilales bacterium]|nr:outer membrane lipoprotein carrier protein LolA [Candidatus Gastranaerophilales bacterium]